MHKKLLIRIKQILPSLTPVESTMAKYVIKHPSKVVDSSIIDLSNTVKISEASIVRFCKTLGYSGYHVFRLSLAQEGPFPTTRVRREVTAGDDLKSIVDKVFKTNDKVLKDTLDCLDLTSLDKAIRAIEQARKVELYGAGDSAWVAADARHKLMKLGIICVSDIDIHTQAMSAALLTKDDVAIAASHSGRTKDTIGILQIAKQCGATTICITNYSNPPIVEYSDIRLFTAAYEISFHSEATASRIAQFSIIDCLYAGLAARGGRKAIASLNKVHKAVADKQYGR